MRATIWRLLALTSTTTALPAQQPPVPVSLGAGLSEDLRIGTADGAEQLQFLRIRALFVDPANGDIYVCNAGSYSIRVFNARGAFVREIGRRGSGPGEFQAVITIRVIGDTLFVLDFSNSRFTAFRRNGDVLATWPIVSTTRGREDVLPMAIASGQWIVSNSLPRPERWTHGMNVATPTVYRRAAAPPPSTSIADVTGDTIVVVPPRDAIGISTPIFVSAAAPLFAPAPVVGFDSAGNTYVHRGAPYEIIVRDLAGKTIRRLTREYTPRAVTSELINEFRRRARAYHDTVTNKGGEYAAGHAIDMARPDLKSPATLPPLGRMVVAPDGAVWVERIDLARDPVAREWTRAPAAATTTLWDRFSSAGAAQRSVELPARFTPMFATGASVLGVQRDEDGVEFVVRYVAR